MLRTVGFAGRSFTARVLDILLLLRSNLQTGAVDGSELPLSLRLFAGSGHLLRFELPGESPNEDEIELEAVRTAISRPKFFMRKKPVS